MSPVLRAGCSLLARQPSTKPARPLLPKRREQLVLDGAMTSANSSKPVIDFREGEPPSTLQIEEITVGDGAEAKPGGTVRVHYLGVDFASGEEFDSSWGRGESIEFPLRGLIQGWQDGIPGMKVGGRRQLTIPPELAYGPAGGGHRLSGQTLIFVIDLLDAR